MTTNTIRPNVHYSKPTPRDLPLRASAIAFRFAMRLLIGLICVGFVAGLVGFWLIGADHGLGPTRANMAIAKAAVVPLIVVACAGAFTLILSGVDYLRLHFALIRENRHLLFYSLFLVESGLVSLLILMLGTMFL